MNSLQEIEKQQMGIRFNTFVAFVTKNWWTYWMNLWHTWSLPPLPPKLIWASIFFSKAFNSSIISVTIVGIGDVEPQPCHSCNVIGVSSLVPRDSVDMELDAHLEMRASGFLVMESIWVLVENARDGERLKEGAKALIVESMVDLCSSNSQEARYCSVFPLAAFHS